MGGHAWSCLNNVKIPPINAKIEVTHAGLEITHAQAEKTIDIINVVQMPTINIINANKGLDRLLKIKEGTVKIKKLGVELNVLLE